MNLSNEFRDPDLCRRVLEQIQHLADSPFRFMEVCGTHTVSIFQSGIKSLLPENISHLSGPGCPVCVTHDLEVNTFLALAKMDIRLATFGDLMRVPGSRGESLKKAQAEGAKVDIVYSAFDALQLAVNNPSQDVVFLAVGFETTAPTVAATLKVAAQQQGDNFFVLPMHKLVPPALQALASDPETRVDGLLLPGHVSTITGIEPYMFLAGDHNIPAVISGFEPLDILQSVLILLRMHREKTPAVINNYKRAVADQGNPRAMEVMQEVFKPVDTAWRGLGNIPGSGLSLRKEYLGFDAREKFQPAPVKPEANPGCRCGQVLKGKILPPQCPLFSCVCTPAAPVGPCMVSTEGSCAAFFKYSL
ncbi:hydrogenase formation protein HypD [Desulfonatronospira sp.]|uniref:hydrogenase formation protein HypD n=1 Tax=Desulfonatronospira sp. TaxID=1962951 RepID=UPI0025BC7C5C|nr:hydrogenase formation protein HypD [Desulfonatronospira sp.]